MDVDLPERGVGAPKRERLGHSDPKGTSLTQSQESLDYSLQELRGWCGVLESKSSGEVSKIAKILNKVEVFGEKFWWL